MSRHSSCGVAVFHVSLTLCQHYMRGQQFGPMRTAQASCILRSALLAGRLPAKSFAAQKENP